MSSGLRLETEDFLYLLVEFQRQAIWIKEESHFAPIKIIHP